MDVKLNQSVMLKLSKLEANRGQIEGLPKNPRIIKDEKFKKLVRSIEENPEMTSLREILVYSHNGKYVVIGGNMNLVCTDGKTVQTIIGMAIENRLLPWSLTVQQEQTFIQQ